MSCPKVDRFEEKGLSLNDLCGKKYPSLLIVAVIEVIAVLSALFLLVFFQISQVRSEITTNKFQFSAEYDYNMSLILQNITSEFVNTIQLQLKQNISSLKKETQKLTDAIYNPGHNNNNPAVSCGTILGLVSTSPSGHYWVKSSNGSAVRVYCDMTRSCGNITGGWMKVAELDMSDSNTQCPSGLVEYFGFFNLRMCVPHTPLKGCTSVMFPTHSVPYSMVCGRIRAYQYGTTNAFARQDYKFSRINTYYVDGISLTHGSPRQHIWTFAAALDEVGTHPASNCLCNKESGTAPVPEHVGNDYFCDTGSVERHQGSVLYYDNPLWDGEGCSAVSTCCSFNNPPWFYKRLPQSTTNDIELRVCKDNDYSKTEDTPIEIIDIYIQ